MSANNASRPSRIDTQMSDGTLRCGEIFPFLFYKQPAPRSNVYRQKINGYGKKSGAAVIILCETDFRYYMEIICKVLYSSKLNFFFMETASMMSMSMI